VTKFTSPILTMATGRRPSPDRTPFGISGLQVLARRLQSLPHPIVVRIPALNPTLSPRTVRRTASKAATVALFALGLHSVTASAGPVAYLTGLGVDTTTGLSATDRTTAQWTPTSAPDVRYAIEDSVNAANGFVGPGYGGQAYDLEALYVQRTATQLIVTGVSGAPLSQIPGTPCASPPCAGTTSTYGMGDFFIGSLGAGGTVFNTRYAVELTGQYFYPDSGGFTTGYATPLARGSIVDVSGSVNLAGGVTSPVGWETGLSAWNFVGAPAQIANGYTTGASPSRRATITTQTLGSGPHYVYQAAISLADLGGLSGGTDWAVRWGEICGNDVLQVAVPTAAQVPVPSSVALLALGGLGLAGAARRRRA
jgi:hypothetical protein